MQYVMQFQLEHARFQVQAKRVSAKQRVVIIARTSNASKVQKKLWDTVDVSNFGRFVSAPPFKPNPERSDGDESV